MNYDDNGTWEPIKLKAFDTLPIGTEVDYDGSVVPEGWSEIQDYSTSEVNTGKVWIDGRPIYRKVFTGTVTSISNLKIGTISNFREAINIYGITSMNNYSTSITQYWDNNIKFIAQVNNANGDVYINAGSSSANQLYKVIIEYTKSS